MNFKNEYINVILRNLDQDLTPEYINMVYDRYDQLREYYDMPVNPNTMQSRRYHTFSHILEYIGTLKTIDTLNDYEYDCLFIALAYHDIVYTTHGRTAKHNETLSAGFVDSILRRIIPQNMLNRVCHLIEQTKHLDPLGNDFIDPFMRDIDLVGLGSSWETFKQNGDLIRMEFSHVSDEDFIKGRIGFFEALMARPSIFMSKNYIKKHEEQARENIERELKELKNVIT